MTPASFRPAPRLLTRLDRLRGYRAFDRPIFILSAPRSGSTFLFDLLSRFDRLWAWHAEVDAIWWRHFPYERSAELSDRVGAEDYSPRAGASVRRDCYRFALYAREERGESCSLAQRLGLQRSIRYLDKTIANCFHVGFLERAFPGALYVLLLRDGRATVSSMMEGWQDPERFVKHQLTPHIPAGSRVSHWAFPAPPGWRAVLDRPLEEVCAWSWAQHVETAAAALEAVPAERKRVLRYEDVLDDPAEAARQMAAFCDLARTPAVEHFLAERPLSRTTVSAPEKDKWRRKHGALIDRVLPAIAPAMRRFGYALAD
jgi:hypothetical protein